MKALRLAASGVAVLAVAATAAPAAAAARDRTPPSTPTQVRVVAVAEDSITVSWNASTDNSGRIHAYVVNGVYHPGTSTTKTITGLVPNHTLTIRVLALDPSENRSGLSAPITGTTAPDTTAPTTPANLRVTATTPSSVSLAWDRASDRWALGYEILRDGAVVGTAAGLTLRVNGLTPGATHTFAVRARDSSGNRSAASNAVTVTLVATGDTAAPTAPANLVATTPPGDFCGSNVLDWDAATDDVDAAAALEYEVFLGATLWHRTRPGETNAFLYTLAGTNTWTVVAVDRSGNRSPASNPATVTVQADANLC